MSTDYAVQMSLAEFIAQANDLGFRLEAVRERDFARLRLIGGSPSGYVYDPHEVVANDGSTWTLFTRYGLNDVSGLAGPLGAVDESSVQYDAITGRSEDRAIFHIKQACAEVFDASPVSASETQWLLEQVLECANAYRDEKRDWVGDEEQEPLPRIIDECLGCGWPWPDDEAA